MVDMRKSSFRVLLALLISCLYLSGCKQQNIEVSEPEVHEIGAMWPEYHTRSAFTTRFVQVMSGFPTQNYVSLSVFPIQWRGLGNRDGLAWKSIREQL